MEKKYLFFVLLLMSFFYTYGQDDSTKTTIVPDTDILDSNHKYPPLSLTKYYYEEEENVKITFSEGCFKKIKYYDTGEIQSETDMSPTLLEISTVNSGYQSVPNVPAVKTTYKVVLKPNGTYKEFSKKGILISLGKYRYGDMNGKWKYYDESGKLTQTKEWKYGAEVRK